MAVRGGTDTLALMAANGWTSATTAAGYVERGRIANSGVILPEALR